MAFRVGVLTISDMGAKGERKDTTGPLIKDMVASIGGQSVKYEIVPDEGEMISRRLIEWADGGEVELILTTGGTGLGPRDVTPEATLKVVDKLVPGIAEAMRAVSLGKAPHGMLSRQVTGVRGRCLIINLPGSPTGVKECLEVILSALPHALSLLRGERGGHTPGQGEG